MELILAPIFAVALLLCGIFGTYSVLAPDRERADRLRFANLLLIGELDAQREKRLELEQERARISVLLDSVK